MTGDVPAGRFDLVYCADTFEVVTDLDAAVAAAARALAPGGLLLFDTVARTPLSRLVYLGLFQAVPMTRIMPPGRYAAARLRPPAEVSAALAAHGLETVDVRGFKPRTVIGLLNAVLKRRNGRVSDDELPDMTDFILEKSGPKPLVTYLGAARHRAG